jgi:hypothetical protein
MSSLGVHADGIPGPVNTRTALIVFMAVVLATAGAVAGAVCAWAVLGTLQSQPLRLVAACCTGAAVWGRNFLAVFATGHRVIQ